MRVLFIKLPLFITFSLVVFSFGCNDDTKLKEREEALKRKEEEFEKEKAALKTTEEVKTNPTVTKYLLVELRVDIPDVTSYVEDVNKFYREEDERAYKDWEENQRSASELYKLIDKGPILSGHPTQPNYVKKYTQSQHYYNLISKVYCVNEFSEDSKYRVMDEFQNQIQSLLTNDDYKANLSYENNYTRNSTIISRKVYVYNTYSEASVIRDSLKNK